MKMTNLEKFLKKSTKRIKNVKRGDSKLQKVTTK